MAYLGCRAGIKKSDQNLKKSKKDRTKSELLENCTQIDILYIPRDTLIVRVIKEKRNKHKYENLNLIDSELPVSEHLILSCYNV